MRYEVIGGMIARQMLDMMTLEPIADLQHVERHGLEVSQYSYAKSAIAANKHLVTPGGEIAMRYKLIGDIPMGITIDELKAIMKRNDRIIIFWKKGAAPFSAIAYSGELDLDVIETLCQKIANSIRDRDTQRSACYKVCNAVDKQFGRIALKPAKELVARICADYNIPQHKIEFRSDLESEVADGRCYTIPFDTLVCESAFNIIALRGGKSMSRDTLLHELAHMIARYEYASDAAIGHGPAFMAIYFELLVRYGFETMTQTQRQMMDGLMKVANFYKVKVDTHCMLVDGEWYAPKPKKRATRGSKRAGL